MDDLHSLITKMMFITINGCAFQKSLNIFKNTSPTGLEPVT